MNDHIAPHERRDEELLAEARAGLDAIEGVDADHVASLWDDIAAVAFADDDSADTTTGHPVQPDTTPTDTTPTAEGLHLVADDDEAPTHASAGGAAADTPARDDTVVDLGQARARRRPGSLTAWLGAAAAALVLVVGGVWVVTQPTGPEPVATFAMDALDERVSTDVDGRIVDQDGTTIVEVDLSALPPLEGGAFYELWLLDLDNDQIVSLGEVDRSTTTVEVQGAIDPVEFPAIDVSVEPPDGVPTHSGDSVLRGPITAADEAG